MTDIRVLLVDDEELVRFGLRTVLEAAGGFTVVGEAGSGAAGGAAGRALDPGGVRPPGCVPGATGVRGGGGRGGGGDPPPPPPPPQVAVLTTFHLDEYVYA